MTTDVGLEYSRLAGFDFGGLGAHAYVGRAFSRASLGVALGVFGGHSFHLDSGYQSGWSIGDFELSLAPVVNLSLAETLRLQTGLGLKISFLDVRSCYDAGDGCWYVGKGDLDLVTTNEALVLPVALTLDVFRSRTAVLFLASSVEGSYFVRSFDRRSEYRPIAAAAALTTGLRY
jgi:hypothetical protein